MSQDNFNLYCVETRRYLEGKVKEYSGNAAMRRAYNWKLNAWNELFALVTMKLKMAWLEPDTSTRMTMYKQALNYFRCFIFCIVHGHVWVSTKKIHAQLWSLAATYEPPAPTEKALADPYQKVGLNAIRYAYGASGSPNGGRGGDPNKPPGRPKGRGGGTGGGGGDKRTTDRPTMKSLFTPAEYASLPPTVPTWAAGKCLGCGSTAHDRDDPSCPAKTGGDVKAWESKKKAQADKRVKRKEELYKKYGFGQ